MIVNGWEGTSIEPITYRLKDFNRQQARVVKDRDGEYFKIYEYSYKALSLIH